MADGSVKIEVILDDSRVGSDVKKVEGRLSGVGSTAKRGLATVGKLAGALGLVGLAYKGIDMVKQSLDGAIDRYDTLNQFPRVMQMIGFDAEESEAAIGKLSDGIQGLPTRLDDVASTAQNIAVMTGDLDSAVDTTLALNNAFLASGASTSDAQRGLQQYVQMLSKGEVDLQSWRTLQETMGVALNQLAKDFGFTGESAQNDLYDALKSGEITFDEFNQKLIEASEAQGGFADMATEASGGIKTSWENIKTAMVSGVANIIGAIDEAMGGTGKIEDVLDKVKVGIQAVFAWIAAQIPKIGTIIQFFKDKLEEWQPTIDKVKDSFTPFAETMMDSFSKLKGHLTPIWEDLKQLFVSLTPILELVGAVIVVMYGIWLSVSSGIIAAIGPVINAVINLVDFVVNMVNVVVALLQGDFAGAWDFWKDAGQSAIDFFMNLMNGIIDLLATIIDTIIDYFYGLYMTLVGNSIIPDMVNAIVEWFVNLWDWLVEIVSGLVDGVVQYFTNLYEKASEIFQTFWDFIVDVWSYIKETFQNALDFILALVTGDFEGMKTAMQNQMENAQKLLSNIWDAIKSLIGKKATEILTNIISRFIEIKNNIQNKIAEAKDALVKRFTEMVSNAKAKAQEILTNIISKFNEIKTNITNKLTEAKNNLVNKFTEMKTSAVRKGQEIVSAAKKKFEAVKNGIRDKLTQAVSVVGQKIGEMPGKVLSFVGQMVTVGKGLIGGLINGIKNMGKKAIEAVTGVVDGVISKAKSLLDINSPSKLFEQFGAWTSEGLAHGIDKMKGLAERASAGLAKGVEGSFNPELTVGGIGGSLKGLTADSIIGNLSGSNLVSHETVTVTNSNNNIASILNEQNQLLGKILNKDQDVYIDSEKITDKVNENNAIIASLNKF